LDSVLGYNSYNFGIDGSSINRQIIKYNAYCREHKSYPKLLIQNIDFIVLGVTSGYERWQFLPLFFDRELVRDVYEYEDFDLVDKYIPLIRYYGYGNKIIPALRTHKDLRKGYSYGWNYPWDGTMFEQMDTVNVSHDEKMIKLFDEFLGEVKGHGTDVVFVYAPIYAEVNQKCDVKMMYDMFSAIAGKHDIPILNYNEIVLCNDTNMFYNATHLNYTGSQIFSRMLAEDLDSLIGERVIMMGEKRK